MLSKTAVLVSAGALVASAAAFAPAAPLHGGLARAAPQRPAAARPALRMQVSEDQEIADAKAKMGANSLGTDFQPKDGPQPVASGGTQYASGEKVAPLFILPSKSVVGDGAMVGDKGFDPLGFADSVEKLRIYREAELKHGRLAMLAALGWPASEALDKPLASAMGMKSLLVSTPVHIYVHVCACVDVCVCVCVNVCVCIYIYIYI